MTGQEPSRARKLLTRCLAIAALLGVYCLATVGVIGVMSATTDITAQARGRGGRGGGRGWRGGGGGRGHYWHGHWWGYGVGPCWRWTPLGWVWICG